MATEELAVRFHDREKVAEAVNSLVENKVPQDQIRVTVEDAQGRELRQIPVKTHTGALRGAVRGAVAGAAFGVVAALLFTLGVFTPLGLEPRASGLVTSLLQAAAVGAVAGVPLGGVLGMGNWYGSDGLTRVELEEGAAVVTVRGEAFLKRARAVLEELAPEEPGRG